MNKAMLSLTVLCVEPACWFWKVVRLQGHESLVDRIEESRCPGWDIGDCLVGSICIFRSGVQMPAWLLVLRTPR